MKTSPIFKILLILALFFVAFLEAIFISLPLTLIFIIVLAFRWEEGVFPWAFAVGLWLDLLLWRHLGLWSMIFLLIAFLTVRAIKGRIFGLERGKLSLPE